MVQRAETRAKAALADAVDELKAVAKCGAADAGHLHCQAVALVKGAGEVAAGEAQLVRLVVDAGQGGQEAEVKLGRDTRLVR
jgi:hypothetical protein